MRIFITGATGHIGSAVVPELLDAGHQVVGLARSDASAAALEAMGSEVRRGDLGNLDGLADAVADVDGVIHLAFDHVAVHNGDLAGASIADLAVVRAFADALAGTGKAFVGIGLGPTGDADVDAMIDQNPRSAIVHAVADLPDRDIRSILVAIPPVVHSTEDRIGFLPTVIQIARRTGVSGYRGDGANHWPAVHTLDLARLLRLGLERAPAGTQLYGAAEDGVTTREIAETIARHLGVPAASIPADQAADHFEGFSQMMALDFPSMTSSETRQLLDWEPTHLGLISDLDTGHYFATT